MTSEKLVLLIEDNAHELTKRLCRDLLARGGTRSEGSVREDVLYERAYEVYSRLGTWLRGNRSKGSEVGKYFEKQGAKLFHEGGLLHEEVMVLMLIKRHLWLFVLETNFFDSTYELQQALRFNNAVVLFFDRAIYHVTTGFQQESLQA